MNDKIDSKELFFGMRSSFGDMVSLLTHDVNNKLSRLMILSDQLVRGAGTSKEMEDKFANTVQDIAMMMRAATAMYLDRDEAELVRVSELVDVGVKAVRKRLDHRCIELIMDVEKFEGLDVLCQAGRLQFAVARLFAFFAKTLPEGAKITVEASRLKDKIRIELRADKSVAPAEIEKESVDIFIVDQSVRADGGKFECVVQPVLLAVIEI